MGGWSLVNNLLKAGALALVALFLGTIGGSIEGRFAPAVTDVEVSRIDPVGETHSRIWGSMRIVRAGCDFAGLEWFLLGTSRRVLADLVFEEGAKERGNGVQDFGPWLVQLTPDQLQNRSVAVAYHDCPWRWWRTETTFYP